MFGDYSTARRWIKPHEEYEAETRAKLRAVLIRSGLTLISAARPGFTAVELRFRNDQLRRRLQEEGAELIHPTVGYWNGEKEAGFLATGISQDSALQIAKEFDQDAVIHDDTLWNARTGAPLSMDTLNRVSPVWTSTGDRTELTIDGIKLSFRLEPLK